MEVIGSGKHSSLLQYGNNYCRKKLYSTGPRTEKEKKDKKDFFFCEKVEVDVDRKLTEKKWVGKNLVGEITLQRDKVICGCQWSKLVLCGLYYKHVTIVIYDRNDSVQYHKTTITIIIDDHNS